MGEAKLEIQYSVTLLVMLVIIGARVEDGLILLTMKKAIFSPFILGLCTNPCWNKLQEINSVLKSQKTSHKLMKEKGLTGSK